MNKIVKKFAAAASGILLLMSAAACSALDVVGKESVKSFEAVLNTVGDRVTADEATGGWMLLAPDGGAAFVWMPDFTTGGQYDVMLVYDMQPFVDAGLDVKKLPESYTIADDKIWWVQSLEAMC